MLYEFAVQQLLVIQQAIRTAQVALVGRIAGAVVGVLELIVYRLIGVVYVRLFVRDLQRLLGYFGGQFWQARGQIDMVLFQVLFERGLRFVLGDQHDRTAIVRSIDVHQVSHSIRRSTAVRLSCLGDWLVWPAD